VGQGHPKRPGYRPQLTAPLSRRLDRVAGKGTSASPGRNGQVPRITAGFKDQTDDRLSIAGPLSIGTAQRPDRGGYVVNSFNLEQPTESSLARNLAALVGTETAEQLIEAACRDLHLNRPVRNLDDLVALTEKLMDFGAEVRVAARSAKVRTITYRAIAGAALR
jgi:hypothetical protein